ncbi:hypothetical protein D3C84_563530 [compost metagenome]
MHQVMGGLEVVPPAFEVSLPEAVHHIDMIERADDVLEDPGAFFFDFPRRQQRQVLEQALVGPLLVIGKHAGSAYVDHQTSPMAKSTSSKDSAIRGLWRSR